MIKINLCPVEELESQYWYLPDVLVAALVAAVCYFSVDYYFSTVQNQINEATEKTASLEASTAQLAPDLKRFETLDKDIKALSDKLAALKRITTSKVDKYMPIIVLEHLQNIKPKGVWYTEMTIGVGKRDQFTLKGQAFDNILTAELMTSMRATIQQEVDPTDLRTQIYFQNLVLAEAKIGGSSIFAELKAYPSFEMSGQFTDRSAEAKPDKKIPKPSSAEKVTADNG